METERQIRAAAPEIPMIDAAQIFISDSKAIASKKVLRPAEDQRFDRSKWTSSCRARNK